MADGTVTKILKDVAEYLKDQAHMKEALLYRRVLFAIEVNTEVDTLIDKTKEIL